MGFYLPIYHSAVISFKMLFSRLHFTNAMNVFHNGKIWLHSRNLSSNRPKNFFKEWKRYLPYLRDNKHCFENKQTQQLVELWISIVSNKRMEDYFSHFSNRNFMNHLEFMNSMNSADNLSFIELWLKASHSTERRIKKPSGFQHFGLKKGF